MKGDAGDATTEAAYYLAANHGKMSVAIDISTPDGKDIVRELARKSDVLIENYKVGWLARHGLNYQSLVAINPRLIYCSITGFGQDGPRAAELGYDFIIQGLAGPMSITGERDDRSGGRRAAKGQGRGGGPDDRALCDDRDPGGIVRAGDDGARPALRHGLA